MTVPLRSTSDAAAATPSSLQGFSMVRIQLMTMAAVHPQHILTELP